MMVSRLEVGRLKEMLDHGEDLVVLDVREPEEIAFATMPGAVAIPMGDIPQRLAELDAARPTAVLCHHGMRSAQVAAFLVQSGFVQVWNVAGGIDAWSNLIDPSVRRY